MKRLFIAAACAAWAVLGSPSFAQTGAAAPWPAAVPGFIAPAANEHPRLFFRKADLPALQARAKTPEGQAIIARLKVLLGGGEAMPASFNDQTRAYEKKQDYPPGTYSISHAAGFGFLYQLTGEKKYAQLGRECFEKAWAGVRDCDDEARYSWVAPGGMLRAGPSLGWYALGYDLCHDGWDAEFRAKTAAEIQNYAQEERGKGAEGKGEPISLDRLARDPKHPPGSNHYGAQVGGAALALLAIRGDAGTDSAKTGPWLDAVEKNLIVEMTKGWGDHGWFAEGDGPAAVAADTALIPAFQAMRVAGGKDFITPRTNVPWMTMKWVMLTQLSPRSRTGREIFPLQSGTYDHNVWSRTALSGAGQFAQGFGAITAEQRPALLWLYNHQFQSADAAANAPFDTVSAYPHRAILSFILALCRKGAQPRRTAAARRRGQERRALHVSQPLAGRRRHHRGRPAQRIEGPLRCESRRHHRLGARRKDAGPGARFRRRQALRGQPAGRCVEHERRLVRRGL